MICIVLVVISASWLQLSLCEQCESPWSNVGSKCVWKSTQLATRSDTLRNCRELGGTLVSPRTLEENQLVKDFIGTDLEALYWLSGQLYVPDMPHLFKYMWMDGKTFNYSDWIPGKPDYYGSSRGICMLINGVSGWHDYPCSSSYMQLCEKRSKSETPAQTLAAECNCDELSETLTTLNETYRKKGDEIIALKIKNAEKAADIQRLQEQLQPDPVNFVVVNNKK